LPTVTMQTEAYNATTTTTTRQEGPGVSLDPEFPKTIMGILMIIASVMGLILIICGSIYPWSGHGGGFIVFIGILAMFGTGALFAIYLLRVVPRVPGPFGLIMLIYLLVLSVLALIGLIVAAVNGVSWGAAIASAVFCVPALGLHIAIGYFMFLKWRQPGGALNHEFHRGECGHAYRTEHSTTSATVSGGGGDGGGGAAYPASEHRMEAPPAYGNY
ncbi:hypothetical protein BOX15_Mlig012081g2, partial [Macrostomum lignano]